MLKLRAELLLARNRVKKRLKRAGTAAWNLSLSPAPHQLLLQERALGGGGVEGSPGKGEGCAKPTLRPRPRAKIFPQTRIVHYPGAISQ